MSTESAPYTGTPPRQHHRGQPQNPINILLIGSTGQGKSTLGNFLLNPDEKCQRKGHRIFGIGTSNLPHTKRVERGRDQSCNPNVLVIDTPGLNEGATKDLEHMTDIVSSLKGLKEITACILVIKFDVKIDVQYKTTIEYYRSLLPKIFEGNILIVMTNFPTDKRSERIREIQGIDVDEVIRNTVAEITSGTDLAYTPQTFLID